MRSHPMWVRGLKHVVADMPFRPQQSHPMWVRGLKLGGQSNVIQVDTVAPHVGAWIETKPLLSNSGIGMSHPMWVRGLKQ